MPPDAVSAGNCVQFSIPEWILAVGTWLKAAAVYAVKSPDDDRTLLNAVFAINAGFATIDYFTQSIVRPLRRKLNKRIFEYKNPDWPKKIGTENSVANLKRREAMSQLADATMRIQNKIPTLFNSQARKWKTVMAIAAAIALVLMSIPYTGRIVLLLALPVPLFAWKCYSKKRGIESECKAIDEKYAQLIKDVNDSLSQDERDETTSRLDDLEKAVNTLIKQMPSNKPKPKRRSTKKK